MMTTRKVFPAFTVLFAALVLSIALSVTPALRAQDVGAEIENSKFQAIGKINSNAVYIRSGASENDYPTMKLDRGQDVTVVGIKTDWLKIIPPDGSYCYVAKAYVEKRGDGSIGRVTNQLNVRVGSTLNAMKTKVAAKLDNGDDVKILGEQDEYFKIAPPKTVFLYVNKQFVDLVKPVAVAEAKVPPAGQGEQAGTSSLSIGQSVIAPQNPEALAAPTNSTGTTSVPSNGSSDPVASTGGTSPAAGGAAGGDWTAGTSTAETSGTGTSATGTSATGTSATGASGTGGVDSKSPGTAWSSGTIPPAGVDQGILNYVAGNNTTDAGPPTTKPADAQAEAESLFDQLEKTFVENQKKTIDQQPIAELQSGYEKLAANASLPESLRRMCEYRLSIVKQSAEDQQRYLAVKKTQQEMRGRQLALQAEREELETRIQQSGVKYFAAVGTLRVSSLQQGGATLYRLTDPKTGRTVVYVRSDDPKLGTFLGQFIGVQGSVATEQASNLKVVAPTGFEVVDQSKVNVTIAAQVVPPSLMPAGTTGTASTGNE